MLIAAPALALGGMHNRGIAITATSWIVPVAIGIALAGALALLGWLSMLFPDRTVRLNHRALVANRKILPIQQIRSIQLRTLGPAGRCLVVRYEHSGVVKRLTRHLSGSSDITKLTRYVAWFDQHH